MNKTLCRAGKWLSANAGAALIAAVIGSAVTIGVTKLQESDTPDIAQQLTTILAAAARDGEAVVVNQTLGLEGNGTDSHVFVFRHVQTFHGSVYQVASDAVAIYDTHKGVLTQVYGFHAAGSSKLPSWLFKEVTVSSFGTPGQRIIVGELVHEYADSQFIYPVAIIWNLASERYVMYSLTPYPLRGLKAAHHPGFYGRLAPKIYRRITIRDSSGSQSVSGYGLDTYNIRDVNGTVYEAGSYRVRGTCNACAGTSRIAAWIVTFSLGRPEVLPCRLLVTLSNVGLFSRDPVTIWLRHVRGTRRYLCG